MRSRLSFVVIAAVFALSFGISQAWAIPNFSPSDLSRLSQTMVDGLIKTAAIGTDQRAYMPATPLGAAIGLDVGVSVTGVNLPSEFTSALNLATGQSNIPKIIPVPMLNLHKGLPYGVDIGFSYIAYQSLLKIYGAEVQWAFLRDQAALPTVALRVGGTSQKLWFIKGTTFKADVVASKNFIFIDPYIGMGIQSWSGSLDYSVNINGLSAGISGSASGVNPHFYAGIPFKLLILHLTGEVDYSTAGITSYGAKLSFNF